MRKKNGFTLIELLVVIVILGIVLSIGTVSVVNYVTSSKEKAKDQTKKNILATAVTYATEFYTNKEWKKDHTSNVEYTFVSAESLIEKGYLKKESITSNTCIKLTRDSNSKAIVNKSEVQGNRCLPPSSNPSTTYVKPTIESAILTTYSFSTKIDNISSQEPNVKCHYKEKLGINYDSFDATEINGKYFCNSIDNKKFLHHNTDYNLYACYSIDSKNICSEVSTVRTNELPTPIFNVEQNSITINPNIASSNLNYVNPYYVKTYFKIMIDNCIKQQDTYIGCDNINSQNIYLNFSDNIFYSFNSNILDTVKNINPVNYEGKEDNNWGGSNNNVDNFKLSSGKYLSINNAGIIYERTKLNFANKSDNNHTLTIFAINVEYHIKDDTTTIGNTTSASIIIGF